MNEAIHYFSSGSGSAFPLEAGVSACGLLPAYVRGLLPACAGRHGGGFGRCLPRQGIHCGGCRAPPQCSLPCLHSAGLCNFRCPTGSPYPAEWDARAALPACRRGDFPSSKWQEQGSPNVPCGLPPHRRGIPERQATYGRRRNWLQGKCRW